MRQISASGFCAFRPPLTIGKIRPIFDGRVSSKRPVNQSQALIISELQTSRWRTHPIGQKLPVALSILLQELKQILTDLTVRYSASNLQRWGFV